MVDSYRWLPQPFDDVYRDWPQELDRPGSFTPVEAPLDQLQLGLFTTAALYHKPSQQPFNTKREREEPAWSDSSYRPIHQSMDPDSIESAHLHAEKESLRQDINTVLPVDHAQDAQEEGLIGSVSEEHFSVVGYQLKRRTWEDETLPEIAQSFLQNGTDLVLLTPF